MNKEDRDLDFFETLLRRSIATGLENNINNVTMLTAFIAVAADLIVLSDKNGDLFEIYKDCLEERIGFSQNKFANILRKNGGLH